jgi:hypothetical protein
LILIPVLAIEYLSKFRLVELSLPQLQKCYKKVGRFFKKLYYFFNYVMQNISVEVSKCGSFEVGEVSKCGSFEVGEVSKCGSFEVGMSGNISSISVIIV